MNTWSRRHFVATSSLFGLGTLLAGCAPKVAPATSAPPLAPGTQPTAAPAAGTAPKAAAPTAASQPATVAAAPAAVAPAAAADGAPHLVVARGADPQALVERALAALGGIERFVKQGHDVIIKPNMCNAYHGPEYASTTNPDVVAALVRLALGAGAKRVRVMDYPFAGSCAEAYAKSGIEAAVKAAGGQMEVMTPALFLPTKIPEGKNIQEWPVYQPVLEADVVINVPIAKHHSMARLTLGAKNLMGVIEDRGGLHAMMGMRIADIASLVRPQLTVIDAVRILMANGPTGGSLDDVKQTGTLIASPDLVAADTYATSLFGVKPSDIWAIGACAAQGLGTSDLSSIKIEELAV